MCEEGDKMEMASKCCEITINFSICSLISFFSSSVRSSSIKDRVTAYIFLTNLDGPSSIAQQRHRAGNFLRSPQCFLDTKKCMNTTKIKLICRLEVVNLQLMKSRLLV